MSKEVLEDKFNRDANPDFDEMNTIKPTKKYPLRGFKIFVRIGHINQNAPGAIGGGIKEVDINKKNGLDLIGKLEGAGARIYGVHGTMSLGDMAKRANALKVDLVLDLHCNSWHDPKANGTLCFYASNKGKKLSTLIQNAISKKTGIRKNYNQKCGHTMVSKTHAVAVIIEYAFISNAEDRANLRDPIWRAKANDGIMEAVKTYLIGG